VGIPASLSVAVLLSKRHWQKLTVFSPSANRSATFSGVDFCPVEMRDCCDDCDTLRTAGARFDPGKSRQYPRTVARTWRYGCDSDARVHAPGLASETNEAYVSRLLFEGHENLRAGRMQTQPSLRSNSRGQGQADFPAQQPASRTCARLPAEDAYARWPGHRVGSAQQGPPLSHCVILRGLEQGVVECFRLSTG